MSHQVKYRINGKNVSKAEFDAHEIPKIVDVDAKICDGTSYFSDATPRRSISMGAVDAEQASLLNSEMRRHGIRGIEWDNKGRCMVTSKMGKSNRALQVYGNLVGLSNVRDES